MARIEQRIINLERSSTTDEPVIIAPLTDIERQRAVELLFREANERPDDAALVRRAQCVRQLLERWTK